MDARPLEAGPALMTEPEIQHCLPDPREEPVKVVLNHWLDLRSGDNPVPPRALLDPVKLKIALPYIWIAQWDQDSGDFMLRLVGERVNNAWGVNMSHNYLRDVMPDDRVQLAHNRWKFLLNNGFLLHGYSPDWRGKEDGVERLISPMSDAEGRPEFILGISVHQSHNPLSDRDEPPAVQKDVFYNPSLSL